MRVTLRSNAVRLSFSFGFLISLIGHAASPVTMAQDCADDQVCFWNVPGAVCADGTETGYSITYRKGAKKLLIYLDGGGACWDYKTCKGGSATHLTAYGKYEGPFNSPQNPMNRGVAAWNSPGTVFGQDYNIVGIPYCTGDVFSGDTVQDYGVVPVTMRVRHVGHRNLKLILEEVSKRFRGLKNLTLAGVSAGGLGATWNAYLLETYFPKADLSVINDGGLLFKEPYISRASLDTLLKNWGAEKTHPGFGTHPGQTPTAEVVSYLQEEFPYLRLGFISSYNDSVMSGYSTMLGAKDPATVVRSIMDSLADNEFIESDMTHVYYLHGVRHVLTKEDTSTIKSDGVLLKDWLMQLTSGDPNWEDVRPK